MRDVAAYGAMAIVAAGALWWLRRRPLGIVNEPGLRWGAGLGAVLMVLLALVALVRLLL